MCYLALVWLGVSCVHIEKAIPDSGDMLKYIFESGGFNVPECLGIQIHNTYRMESCGAKDIDQVDGIPQMVILKNRSCKLIRKDIRITRKATRGWCPSLGEAGVTGPLPARL